MVRREADESLRLGEEFARCAFPAGVSPAPVSVGAPGSRPQVFGGDPFARAGRQEPMTRQCPSSGEQVRGPQHEVKPAASTDSQSGSRAAHVTAKAMSIAGREPKPATDSGGVRGVARGQGDARNTRDPSARPLSRQARPYKPKAKSGRVQRESEGIVVPSIAVKNNAAEGRVPGVMVSLAQVSAREWPPRADLATPAALGRSKKCDNCKGDCGAKPSHVSETAYLGSMAPAHW